MPAYPIEKIFDIIRQLELDINIMSIEVDIPICNKKNIPEKVGIYIIKNYNGNRYIGISKNILSRQSDRYFENATVDVFLIEDISIAKDLESVLVFILQPELNRSGKGSYLHRRLDEKGRIDYVKNTFEYRNKYSTYIKMRKMEDEKIKEIEYNKLKDKLRELEDENKRLKEEIDRYIIE